MEGQISPHDRQMDSRAHSGVDQKVYLPSQLERSQSQTTQRGLQIDQNC
jgi:hypothetical protein